MDQNKLKKLHDIGYKINGCCGICAHANSFNDDWTTCKVHTYNHLKHTDEVRQLSVFIFGSCPQFELHPDVDLEKWNEFLPA